MRVKRVAYLHTPPAAKRPARNDSSHPGLGPSPGRTSKAARARRVAYLTTHRPPRTNLRLDLQPPHRRPTKGPARREARTGIWGARPPDALPGGPPLARRPGTKRHRTDTSPSARRSAAREGRLVWGERAAKRPEVPRELFRSHRTFLFFWNSPVLAELAGSTRTEKCCRNVNVLLERRSSRGTLRFSGNLQAPRAVCVFCRTRCVLLEPRRALRTAEGLFSGGGGRSVARHSTPFPGEAQRIVFQYRVRSASSSIFIGTMFELSDTVSTLE